MLNLLLYSKTTQEGNPTPFLTDNLNIEGIKIMAEKIIPKFLGNGKDITGRCLRDDYTIKRFSKHGMYKASIYECFHNMIQRCENPNHPSYKNYGARGIKVCDRWHKFENFYADVGDPPGGKSLDRWPNKDGNYEPTNWRWASRKEQRANSRPTSHGPARQRWFVGFNKKTGIKCLSNNQRAFARRWEIDDKHISACLKGARRINKGWEFKWID